MPKHPNKNMQQMTEQERLDAEYYITCDRCGTEISQDEVRSRYGRNLCECCYED